MFFLFPLFTWVFLFVALVFQDQVRRRTFIVLMAFHYTYLLLFPWVLLTQGLDPNEVKYWKSEPVVVVFSTIVYLAGQVAAWTSFAIGTWTGQLGTKDARALSE